MDANDLGYAETLELLEKLGPLSRDLVLVGGQAVNFWAQTYLPRTELLLREVPFTSKDIDFCGSAASAQACARALGGTCAIPSMDDMTPCTGVVQYVDQFAQSRVVDFLGAPFGLDVREVKAMAIALEEATPRGVLELRVMHPVHVLESRASNVDHLPGYRSPNGLKQLRAAVVCSREFSRDLLDDGRVRDVLRLNERIFRFSLRGHGMGVWLRDKISTFDAVLLDPRLPEGFMATRYPQMLQELRRHRDAAFELMRKRGMVAPPGDYVFEGVGRAAGERIAHLTNSDGHEVVARPWSCALELEEGDRVRVSGDGSIVLLSRGIERGR